MGLDPSNYNIERVYHRSPLLPFRTLISYYEWLTYQLISLSTYRNVIEIQNLKVFESDIKNNSDEELFGIFFIKIKGWNATSFIESLILTDQGFYIFVNSKYSKTRYEDIKDIKLNKNKQIEIVIKNNDNITFDMVEIDDKLTKANKSYNEKLNALINGYIKYKRVNQDLLASIPNQKSIGYNTQRFLPLIITGFLLITFGLFLQTIFFTISWMLLVTGIIITIISATFAVVNFNKYQS